MSVYYIYFASFLQTQSIPILKRSQRALVYLTLYYFTKSIYIAFALSGHACSLALQTSNEHKLDTRSWKFIVIIQRGIYLPRYMAYIKSEHAYYYSVQVPRRTGLSCRLMQIKQGRYMMTLPAVLKFVAMIIYSSNLCYM